MSRPIASVALVLLVMAALVWTLRRARRRGRVGALPKVEVGMPDAGVVAESAVVAPPVFSGTGRPVASGMGSFGDAKARFQSEFVQAPSLPSSSSTSFR